MSALFRWPCNNVAFLCICLAGLAAGVRCHWWCPPFSAGHVAVVFICLPGLSLLVSALSVTAGVRPFPLAMQQFNSFVFKVISLLLSPRFGACTAGVRPFPLAMQNFYSFVPQVCHWWCPPFSAGHAAFLFIYSFVSQVCHWWCPPFSAGHVAFLFMVCHCWCPPFSVGHVAFLCICLPGPSLLVSAVTGGVRPFPLAM